MKTPTRFAIAVDRDGNLWMFRLDDSRLDATFPYTIVTRGTCSPGWHDDARTGRRVRHLKGDNQRTYHVWSDYSAREADDDDVVAETLGDA